MKKIILLIIIIASGLAQLTILNSLKVFNIRPDLLLICAVSAALIFELRWSLLFCLCAGIFKDIFSIGLFGINTLLFCLWGYCIASLNRKISIDDTARRVILVFIVSLIHNIIMGAILVNQGNNIPLGILFKNFIFISLLTALVSPLWFKWVPDNG